MNIYKMTESYFKVGPQQVIQHPERRTKGFFLAITFDHFQASFNSNLQDLPSKADNSLEVFGPTLCMHFSCSQI